MRILDIARAMRREQEVYQKYVGVCGARTNEHPEVIEAKRLLREAKIEFMKCATHSSEGDLELLDHDYLQVMDSDGSILLMIEGPALVRAEYFLGVELNVYFDHKSQYDTTHAHFELIGVDDQGMFYAKSTRKTEMVPGARGIGKSPETLGELFRIYGNKDKEEVKQ